MAHVATLDNSSDTRDRLPRSAPDLFAAKASKGLTFESLATELGRSEVACAALFYGQAQASHEDVTKLAHILGMDQSDLAYLMEFPNRGHVMGNMQPVEPLQYRLWEVIKVYGSSYKAVINEKFGDGIMSAISFSTQVQKETNSSGDWVVITMKGKWLPYSRF